MSLIKENLQPRVYSARSQAVIYRLVLSSSQKLYPKSYTILKSLPLWAKPQQKTEAKANMIESRGSREKGKKYINHS